VVSRGLRVGEMDKGVQKIKKKKKKYKSWADKKIKMLFA